MAWTSARRGALLLAVLCASVLSASSQPADAMAATAAPAAVPAAAAPAVPTAAASGTPVRLATDSQNMTAFFPAVNGDLTKITWAHAVNNQSHLTSALASDVMMLEADVLLGKTSDTGPEEPIMGHPPATRSDLSLQQFLRSVTTYNTDKATASKPKGIKLDFKSIDVFEKALDTLKSVFGDVPKFPVWLNADVLEGPVNATAVPVDATRFLAAAKRDHPELMLSLGWTTRWGKDVAEQAKVPVDEVKYSQDNVREMIAALNAAGVTQPITYAVRAAFVANSLPELKSLLDQTSADSDASLTVWSSDDTDVVDAKLLRKNILELGKNRVFVDVGDKLAKDLDLANSSASTCASVATVAMALMALMLL